MPTKLKSLRNLKAVSRRQGGILTAEQLRCAGIHARTLKLLQERERIEKLDRGIYRFIDATGSADPDVLTAMIQIPKGVICLVSALSWHNMTTRIPDMVEIAIPRNTHVTRRQGSRVRVHRFSGAAYEEGIEKQKVDGATVRVYGPEKTVADCFRFRDKIGIEAVLEALQLYREHKPLDMAKLLHYSRVCRVEGVMLPYIRTLLLQ